MPDENEHTGLLEAFRQKAERATSKAWVPYQGPRGGSGWQNPDSGEVVYGEDPPGETADADDIEDMVDADDPESVVSAAEDLGMGGEFADRVGKRFGDAESARENPDDMVQELVDMVQEAGETGEVSTTPSTGGDGGDGGESGPGNGGGGDGGGSADEPNGGGDGRVGEDHLVTNPMTGDEMNAEVTGESLVPRGSESGEEQYPVEFENGDTGYVPADEIDPDPPSTDEVNTAMDAVTDEVRGNTGEITYDTVSEVVSADSFDTDADETELVDAVAEEFGVGRSGSGDADEGAAEGDGDGDGEGGGTDNAAAETALQDADVAFDYADGGISATVGGTGIEKDTIEDMSDAGYSLDGVELEDDGSTRAMFSGDETTDAASQDKDNVAAEETLQDAGVPFDYTAAPDHDGSAISARGRLGPDTVEDMREAGFEPSGVSSDGGMVFDPVGESGPEDSMMEDPTQKAAEFIERHRSGE